MSYKYHSGNSALKLRLTENTCQVLPTAFFAIFTCLQRHTLTTVRLGKMAQHARLWALVIAKLEGQSQNASNMALGELIGLQHIQISAS